MTADHAAFYTIAALCLVLFAGAVGGTGEIDARADRTVIVVAEPSVAPARPAPLVADHAELLY